MPTDSDDRAVGALLLIASRTLGPLTLDLNAGYARRRGDGMKAPRSESLWAAALGGPLGGRFGWVGELSGSPAASGPAGRPATVNLLVGATANLSPSLVVDVAVRAPVFGPDSSAILTGAVWNVGRSGRGAHSSRSSLHGMPEAASSAFPVPLGDYPQVAGGLLDTLSARIAVEPFNAIATAIFVTAIVHTFAASWFARLAHRAQHRHDESCRKDGRPRTPSILAESLHFLGEVEVVFGLWAAVLLVALDGR